MHSKFTGCNTSDIHAPKYVVHNKCKLVQRCKPPEKSILTRLATKAQLPCAPAAVPLLAHTIPDILCPTKTGLGFVALTGIVLRVEVILLVMSAENTLLLVLVTCKQTGWYDMQHSKDGHHSVEHC